MGKWTAGYHDDVLASKMKGLVAGALKRSKIDQIEPSITYEAFVEELDGGDSFTTSLIDVLVKELAERRTRQTAAERRLIADRTAKSLRQMATPVRIYRDRSYNRGPTGRRTVNLTDYLSPPEEMYMDDEGDEFDALLHGGDDPVSYLEGARVNSDLYDAYNSQGWGHPMSTSLSRHSQSSYLPSSPPAPLSDSNNTSDTTATDPLSRDRRRWGMAASGPGATLITRQPSIRRPMRSRTVDFNDFSSRHRSARRSIAELEDARSPDEIPNTHSSWVSGPTSDEPLGSSSSARRFFPFSRRRQEGVAAPWSTFGRSSRPVSPEPMSFRPWRSSSGPPPLVSSSSYDAWENFMAATNRESPESGPPLLRRGGLRPPESMLSRHASPVAGDAEASSTSIVIAVSQEVHREVDSAISAAEAVIAAAERTERSPTEAGA